MTINNKIFEFKKKEIQLIRNTTWYNYKYADLEQIQEKIWPILEELKLLIIHRTENQKVITRIIDLEDDSFIESSLDIWEVKTETKKDLIDKNQNKIWESIEINTLDPQWVWSIITYYRRYNILQLLDLKIDDDDWANWSQRAQVKQNYTSQNIETKTETKTDNQYWKCSKCWADNVFNPKTWKIFCSDKCFLPKKIESQQDLSEIPF